MKHLLYLFFTMSCYISQAQDTHSQQLWGTWSLVSVENINPDGSTTAPYGDHPVGILVFTASGKYAIQILKANRSKVATNDKDKATAEENAALVRGSNAHYGIYTVDENKQTIVFNVQHAFYPNWEGGTQVRSYAIQNNLLTYTVTTPTNGGASMAKVVWKKDQ
ncbi:Lipocalin-like domain-containing protein [Chitinophaga jiangningensis]|uniref:Lipocalin-like domain-containing protein n=1 Tax=Chitinophaga jiangningensis TaxID=1419482 RepID=A0A1M7JDE8_9BACT|nr:lipocalin-like domain-containing protein [Chitinophaga jiangningensis]SHM50978.1 Lipocalin-like domain-containing protein [Chitinophaga jiangningensis]